MPLKVKTGQSETPDILQTRDFFKTPRYATEMIIPFIPYDIDIVWECAAGEGHISKVLKECGFTVFSSDIHTLYPDTILYNFINDEILPSHITDKTIIITNPAFSIKRKFYQKCIKLGLSFALLIPADYSSWNIDAIRYDGCEKIIPTRRINYFTPTDKEGSGAQFHSLWLTRGLGLGKSETFVELSIDDIKNKKNI